MTNENDTGRGDGVEAAGPRSALLAIVALGLLVRLLVIADGWRGDTLASLVPDDAFYYLTIARHVVEGLGSTFDGMAPTNGYHPLWMLLLLPVLAARLADGATVAAVLTLSALLWAIAGLFLIDLVERLFAGRTARVTALLLYALHPFAFVLSLDGLETSLVVALHLALFAWLARRGRSDARWSGGSALAYGALCGLLFLARTDSAFVIAAVSLGLLFGDEAQTVRRKLAWLATAGAVAAVFAAPWIAWNLHTFGSLEQTSGSALTFFRYTWALEIEGRSTLAMVEQALAHLARGAAALSERLGAPIARGEIAGAALCALFATAWLLGRKRLRGPDRAWIASAASGAASLVLVHALVRWVVRDWYFAVVFLLAVLAVAAIVEALGGRTGQAVAALCLLAPLAGSGALWRDRGLYPLQLPWWVSAGDPAADSGLVMGASDAGISGFRQKGNHVVNLDGLVNNEVIDYYRRGEGIAYVFDKGLDHVALRMPYLHPRFMGPGGLHLVAGEPGAYGVEGGAHHFRPLSDPVKMYVRFFPRDRLLAMGKLENNIYLGNGWRWHTEDLPLRWSTAIDDAPVLYLPLLANRSYDLTLRLRRQIDLDAPQLALSLNGTEVATVPLGADWQDRSVRLPGEHVVDGVNTLVLAIDAPPPPRGWRQPRVRFGIALESMSVQVVRPAMSPPPS